MACGQEAALCGPTSAVLQDIGRVPSSSIHVRSPNRSGRRRQGITVHRGEIDPRDLRIVDNIRCTSADLVLVELAPTLTESELEVILIAAESRGYLKRGRLGELVAERRGRPGIPKLERLLELEPAFANSGVEIEILPIARLAGLERPKVNLPITVSGLETPLIVDAAWPELRMVIEADSQRFHGDWERAKADRERDQLLALAGWRCHRFPRDRFKEREWMAERVGALARIGLIDGRSDPAAGAAASGERVG